MDVNASTIIAQQQAASQLQLGQAMLKRSAQAEQKTAAILAEAITSTASAGKTRGLNLDISV